MAAEAARLLAPLGRTCAAMGPVPPLLMVWPQPEEGAWFAEVFAAAEPAR